jgi:hypothetical protein
MNKERQQHDHDVQRRGFKKYILPVTLQYRKRKDTTTIFRLSSESAVT